MSNNELTNQFVADEVLVQVHPELTVDEQEVLISLRATLETTTFTTHEIQQEACYWYYPEEQATAPVVE